MKAVIIRAFGGPEQLVVADMPKPVAGPNQVLVRVKAASINPVDYKVRLYPSNWAGVPVPAILGYDAAGVVEEVGIGVTHLHLGDEVMYSPKLMGRQGSYAQYHVEDADIVVKKPANLSFIEAASLPLAGMTTYDVIVSFFATKPGDTVLIHAGAGGVGSLAVQMAKAAGALVIATGRKENHDFIRSLGADFVIDYRQEKFEDAVLAITKGKGADAAFDTVGGDTIVRSSQCVRPFGKLSTIVDVSGDIHSLIMKNQTFYGCFMERTGQKMQALATMAERGQLKAVIDSVITFDQIADAHRRIESGGMKGKIVITID